MKTLLCGFAQEKITPKLNGFFLDGYGFRMSPAESVRDDLYVKVCAMRWGEESYLIASFDLLGFSPSSYELTAEQITAYTGIPRENMALCWPRPAAAFWPIFPFISTILHMLPTAAAWLRTALLNGPAKAPSPARFCPSS